MKVLIGPSPMRLDEAIPALQQQYPEVEFVYAPTPEAVIEQIVDADAYAGSLTRDAFLAAKQLKWVQSTSTGVDKYLAIPELKASPIPLTNARGTHADCLAESTFAMLLAIDRGVKASVLAQPEHKWATREIRATLQTLTDAHTGIVGFGTIGQAIARVAHAFKMRVTAVDMFPKDKPEYVEAVWGLDRLDDLLRQSDYVVIAVPGTPETRDMINADRLSLMKPTAMLLGISRGGIINQEALIAALEGGKLRAAALDVCEPEPLPPDNPLWDAPGLLLCAHIAGGTPLERQYMLDIFAENIGKYLRGESPLRNQVNKELGF